MKIVKRGLGPTLLLSWFVFGCSGSGADGDAVPATRFSFFVTSQVAIVALSHSDSGFGGDLTFGETGPGAGLRGADKICAAVADRSLEHASRKQWRAFLSANDGGAGQPVHAIERVGNGPWYDRKGRLVAASKADLLMTRPAGADAQIINDLPNEDGVPNHAPDGSHNVDNHDILTGTNAQGQVYGPNATCRDWTSTDGANAGRPRVGHSWPRSSFGGPSSGPINPNSWISALDEAGCAAGFNTVEMGPPDPNTPTVGSGGGYGGLYCFALTP